MTTNANTPSHALNPRGGESWHLNLRLPTAWRRRIGRVKRAEQLDTSAAIRLLLAEALDSREAAASRKGRAR